MKFNENIKVIGLTGMSGAGKSTACKMFEQSGFKIIDCDAVCREIVKKGKKCLDEIVEYFGQDILDDENCLNRAAMGKLIFSDSEKRKKLNSIMYPYVSYIVICEIISSETDVLIDAPTLFESEIDSLCSCIISVVADKDILVDRIVKRDNINSEDAEKRLDSQYPAEFFISRSDYVIKNNGSHQQLVDSVKKIIRIISDNKE